MKRRPYSKSSGTVTKRLMTNNVVIFNENFFCSHWERTIKL